MGIGAARADFENFVSCDRATSATAVVGGELSSFAAGAAVRYPDPEDATRGVMRVEPQATNRVRNSICQGAVAGRLNAGGALPDHWQPGISGLPASAVEVVGFGSEGGVDYVRLRYQGTTTAGSVLTYFEGSQNIAATHGEVWAQSAFLRLVAGDVTGITTTRLIQVNSSSSGYHSGGGGAAVALGPDWIRATAVREKDDASGNGAGAIAYVQPALQFVTASTSEAIDLTLDIGLPQMELGTVTSPIRTSGAMATRAADVVTTPAPVSGGVFSILFEVKLAMVPDTGSTARLIDLSGQGQSSAYIGINTATGAARMVAIEAEGSGKGLDIGALSAGEWLRIAAVFDGATWRGKVAGSALVEAAGGIAAEGLAKVAFGADGAGERRPPAAVEYRSVTIYDRALSSAGITELVEGAS